MVKKKIRQAVYGISCMVVVMTTGCLQTPDLEYVTNKEGQNTLISDHIAADNGIPIRQQVQAPERVEAACEKVNEYTTIEVDATVVVPSAATVPVYTVSPVQLDAQAVEAYTGILFETGEFYNREYDKAYLSVDGLQEEIAICTKALETAEITTVSEPVQDENGMIIEMNAEDAQMLSERVQWLQEELAEALERPCYGSPVSYDFEEHTSKIAVPTIQDGMITTDMEGETYDYIFQYAAFIGRHNGIEYDLSVYRDGLNTELRFALPWQSIRLSNGYLYNEIDLQTEYKGGYMEKPNTCNFTQEEAVAVCKDFLAELGIDNMEARYATDVYMFYHMGQQDEEFLGKKGWKIYMYWEHGGMGECFSPQQDRRLATIADNASKISILKSEMEEEFIRMVQENEEISTLKTMKGMAVFTVLDDGIIDAWIQNPMENKELLAEHVTLLDFDHVLEQGIAHLETLYGDSGTHGSYGEKDITIRVIELNYARMQAPNTEGEFAMIPVWDFKTNINGECMVSINAIDGSTFNREKGY